MASSFCVSRTASWVSTTVARMASATSSIRVYSVEMQTAGFPVPHDYSLKAVPMRCSAASTRVTRRLPQKMPANSSDSVLLSGSLRRALGDGRGDPAPYWGLPGVLRDKIPLRSALKRVALCNEPRTVRKTD